MVLVRALAATRMGGPEPDLAMLRNHVARLFEDDDIAPRNRIEAALYLAAILQDQGADDEAQIWYQRGRSKLAQAELVENPWAGTLMKIVGFHPRI